MNLPAVAAISVFIITAVVYMLGYYRGRFCEIYSDSPTDDTRTRDLINSLQEEIAWLRQEFDLNCAMGRLNLRATLDRERDWFLKSFEKETVRTELDNAANDIDNED